jgi:hypothetical protein
MLGDKYLFLEIQRWLIAKDKCDNINPEILFYKPQTISVSCCLTEQQSTVPCLQFKVAIKPGTRSTHSNINNTFNCNPKTKRYQFTDALDN